MSECDRGGGLEQGRLRTEQSVRFIASQRETGDQCHELLQLKRDGYPLSRPPPIGTGSTPSRIVNRRAWAASARSLGAVVLIAYDRATLVAHPIGEAEVVHPDVVKSGAHGCGCAQRRSPAAFAMGDDVVARAETCALTACFAAPAPDERRHCPANRHGTGGGHQGDARCAHGCARPLR